MSTAIAKQIKEMSEQYRNFTAQILSKMVQTKAYSSQEKDRCDLIVKLCNEAGCFDEVRVDAMGNVIAKMGHGSRILCYDAHIDSVEVGDISQWEKDPFSGEIADGYVYGLGSNDQLGGAACMIASAKMLKELAYDGDFTIYYTFTCMEEDCDGLCWIYIWEKEGIHPDYFISTEPCDRTVFRGHRGRMEIEVILKGKSAHGSIPHMGDSAAYKASRAALALEQLDKDLQPDDDGFLGKGSLTVSSMHVTGPSQCSVPDIAKIYIDRRLTWGETADLAIQQVKDAITKAIGEEPYKVYMPTYPKRGYKGLDFTQELYFPTWKVPEDHELVQAACKCYAELFDEPNHKPGRNLGSTNAVAYAGRYGAPALQWGPGSCTGCHIPNEKNSIDDLVFFDAMYTMLPYLL